MGQRDGHRNRLQPWVIRPLVLVLLASALPATPAFAGASGTDGPGGTVSVGATDGGSSGGTPGSLGTGGSSSSGGPGSGGGSPWTCTYTSLLLNDIGGFPPGGATPGGWYSVTCVNRASGASSTQTEWITRQPTALPPATPAIDPRVVALQAENSLRLPAPSLRFNPAASSVVNLPTWLWIDPSIWRQMSVTASVGTVSATAVATPEVVIWQTGDGGQVVCDGPGQPFLVALPAQGQGTACAHTYRFTSAGQVSPDGNPNDAAFPVRATITWAVSWAAEGAPGQGVLPPLVTTGAASVRVVQVQSINSTPVGAASPLAARSSHSLGGLPS